MKYKNIIYVLVIFSLIGFSACSELNNDISTNPGVNVHGSGALTPGSSDFHGQKVAMSDKENKLNECQTCHAADFSGGTTNKSCVTCHNAVQVHGKLDYTVEDHLTFFNNNSSIKLDDCSTCHQTDLNGGVAAPSCLTCHPAVEVHKPSSEKPHYEFLAENLWDTEGCQTCHGVDFAGKENRTAANCTECHTNANGPNACNTCHGDFEYKYAANDSIDYHIAPPNGLRNKSDRNEFVGAHQLHLKNTLITFTLECGECHIVPKSVGDPSHIDDGRADINFGQIRATAANGDPTYDQAQMQCSNVYCHGNFAYGAITGNNFSPKWTVDDGSQAKCGTCHGELDQDGNLVTPRPTGHFGNYVKTDCYLCHSSVVDDSGAIIDPNKHINGQKDF